MRREADYNNGLACPRLRDLTKAGLDACQRAALSRSVFASSFFSSNGRAEESVKETSACRGARPVSADLVPRGSAPCLRCAIHGQRDPCSGWEMVRERRTASEQANWFGSAKSVTLNVAFSEC